MTVTLVPADLGEATAMIVEHHYLHRGRRMAQVAYWARFDGARCGVVLFSLPRMSVPFHGHPPMALLELARLWLSPDVQGRETTDRHGRRHSLCVASRTVGAALRRVRADWATKYPRLPAIEACVSWASLDRHVGTVYEAANFVRVGETQGRNGHNLRHADYAVVKATYLYSWKRPYRALPARGLW
ncbi:MAG: hypothetical protein ACRD0D_00925 [Acidimicrobiales bacterium]